ncbi:MAG: sigma-70 family RNA polymerase sigma factor [Eubacterium sp.]|nr:sigma-70 family RNA polymerase sigma factor [Eubacterium sp.]
MKRRSREQANEDIIEALLLENYDRYYRLAHSYVHNDDDAADIVQNSAYKAIKNCGSLKQNEFAATWLYRIVLNEIFTFCRQKKTEALDAVQNEPQAMDVYENIDLKRALETLPAEDKMIVELKYFEEMKLEEIASLMQENINTIKSRLYRSIKKLRLRLDA